MPHPRRRRGCWRPRSTPPRPNRVRVSFVVPAFAQRFGQDALVDVTACRETVCARATVMLGDGFSAALPTTATAAEVTAQLIRDTGALKVTLQVPDPGTDRCRPRPLAGPDGHAHRRRRRPPAALRAGGAAGL